MQSRRPIKTPKANSEIIRAPTFLALICICALCEHALKRDKGQCTHQAWGNLILFHLYRVDGPTMFVTQMPVTSNLVSFAKWQKIKCLPSMSSTTFGTCLRTSRNMKMLDNAHILPSWRAKGSLFWGTCTWSHRPKHNDLTFIQNECKVKFSLMYNTWCFQFCPWPRIHIKPHKQKKPQGSNVSNSTKHGYK